MKKYFTGILLIAGLATVIGVNFFNGAKTAEATLLCHPANQDGYSSGCTCNGIVYSVGETTTYSANGNLCCGSNGYETACGSVIAPGGNSNSGLVSSLTWSNNFYSSLYANTVSWVNGNGKKVNPKKVTTDLNYYDQNGKQIFLVGANPSKVASFVNDFVAGRKATSGSTERALPCGDIGHGANGISNGSAVQCCETKTDSGVYAWNLVSAHSCDAIIVGNSNIYTPAQ